jgi:anti-sigma B factor antagonist
MFDKPGYGKDDQGGSFRIEPQYLPGDDTVVVEAVGDLSGDAAQVLKRTIADELARSPALLVVDLSGVARVDADGVDALASSAATAGESDISFGLVAPRGSPIRDALAAAVLLELFEIFWSVDEAVEDSR